MTEAAKRPWYLSANGVTIRAKVDHVTALGMAMEVETIVVTAPISGHRKSDLELIVKAVNSRDEMLAALREIEVASGRDASLVTSNADELWAILRNINDTAHVILEKERT